MNRSTVISALARGIPGQGRPLGWRAGIHALVLCVALIAASSVTAQPPFQGQPPAPPLRLFGQVSLGAGLAPDGTVVTASISGTTTTKSTTTTSGSYSFNVPADDPNTTEIDGGVDGATVTLYVGGGSGYTGDPAACQIAFDSGGVPPARNLDVPSAAALDISLSASPGQPGVGQQVTLSGTVRDMDGSPVAGATVSASWADGSQDTQGSTGGDGTFSLGHAYASSGTFLVQVTASNAGMAPDSGSLSLVVGISLTSTSPPPSGGGSFPPPTETESPALTPTPTTTPTPTSTPTPTATLTPIPTALPSAVPALTPTQSPTATAIPAVSPTPSPIILVPTPTPSPTIVVAPTPSSGTTIEVSSLSVSQDTAEAGEPIIVQFSVTNTGSRESDYAIDILVNGGVDSTVTGSLLAGASRTLVVSIIRSEPGAYTVAVEGLVESFAIAPALMEISQLNVSPGNVGAGDAVTISAWIANLGGSPGDYEVDFTVAGNTEGSFTGTLPAGSSKPLVMETQREQPGTYSVTVGNLAGQFVVLEPLLDMEIPQHVLMGEDTTQARDMAGNVLAVTGNTADIEETESGDFEVVLPVALEEGGHLMQLYDAASGILLAENEIRIPILDAQGQEAMSIVAEVTSTVGTGTQARARLNSESLRLEVPEKSVDLSGSNPTAGRVSVSISARLNKLPDQARISVTAKESLTPDAQSGFELLAQESDSTIASVGAAVEVTRTNLENGRDIGTVTLQISVGAPWVEENGGIEKVLIARRGDDGLRQFLPTTFIGDDGEGHMTFEAISERGFSVFSILALAPTPEIDFQDLTIQPEIIAPGEGAEVTVTAVNAGDIQAMSTVILRLNGEPYQVQSISLEPGSQKTLSFFLTREQVGKYQVEVGGLTGELEVALPLSAAQVTATSIRISPEQINPGDMVTITATVSNTGAQTGKLDIPLKINGVLAQLVPVLVPGGGTAEVTFTLSPQIWGKYTVEVLGMDGNLEVTRVLTKASLVVTDLSVSSPQADQGEPVTVTFTASNTGEQAGTFTIVLMINGQEERRLEVSLEGLSSTPQSLQVVRDQPGEYEITLDDLSATFEVTGSVAPETQPTPTALPEPEEQGRNWLPIVLLVVLVPLLAAGAAAAYFMVYRPRRSGTGS